MQRQPDNAQGELPHRHAKQGDPEAVVTVAFFREPRERHSVGDDGSAVSHEEPGVERTLLRAESHVRGEGALESDMSGRFFLPARFVPSDCVCISTHGLAFSSRLRTTILLISGETKLLVFSQTCGMEGGEGGG